MNKIYEMYFIQNKKHQIQFGIQYVGKKFPTLSLAV